MKFHAHGVFTPLYGCRLFLVRLFNWSVLIDLRRGRFLADRGDDRKGAITHLDETRKVPCRENSVECGAVPLRSYAGACHIMNAGNEVALAYFRAKIDQRFKQTFGIGKAEAFLRWHIEPCRG